METVGPGPKRPVARPTKATRGTTHLASSAATFNGEYEQPTTNRGGRSVQVARIPAQDRPRRCSAIDCRAARPRARDERQGRSAAWRGARAGRLDPIGRNSADALHGYTAEATRVAAGVVVASAIRG